MAWPLNQDYNEAIQDPRSCLSDPELRDGEVVCNTLGLPRPRSGNFADVYEMRCPGGGRYAVKCFTREVRGLQARYQAISDHLHQAKLPFTVDFKYLEKGIQIRGQWYPILKMQWVEGFTLNEFVRQHLDKPAMLDGLLQIWTRMAKRLREAQLAHADLQHGNVLLVPGSTASSLAVKLIDYDGMHVPALAGKQSGEVGHPAYQHPQRLREGTYNPEVDRFPLLVISAALRCLMAGGRELWERYDTGDNLVFRETDLRQPEQSELFAELRQLKDPLAVELVQRVAAAVLLPLEQAPLLEELFPDRQATPARPAAKGKQGIVEKKPGEAARPARATTIQSEPSAAPTAADAWGGLEQTEPAVRRIRKEPVRGAFPLMPIAVAGSVAGLVLVGLLAWALSPPTPTKPASAAVAQAAPNDNPKPNPMPVPRDKDKKERPQEPVRPPVIPPVIPPEIPPVNPPPVNPLPKPPPGALTLTSKQFKLPNPVLAVALARDGQLMALGCEDGTIHTGSTSGMEPLKTRKAHNDEVRGLAFLPDGLTLVSAGRDGTLKWWDLDLRNEKRSVLASPGGLTCLALSPDGQLLATGGPDGLGKILDQTGQVKAVTQWSNKAAVNGVVFSPESKWLATVAGANLYQWNAATGLSRVGGGSIGSNIPFNAVAYSPDGQTLAVGIQTGNINLVPTKGGPPTIRKPRREGGAINALAYSPDGMHLAVGYADGVACLCRAPDFKEAVSLLLPQGEIKALAFDGTGSVLIVGDRDGRVIRYSLPKPNAVAVQPDPPPVKPPDNANPPGVREAGQRRMLATPGIIPNPEGLVFSKDGQTLMVAAHNKIHFLDPETGNVRRPAIKAHTNYVGPPKLSRNGKVLATPGFDDRTVKLWNPDTGALLQTLAGHTGLVYRAALRADGQVVASLAEDKTLRVWDADTGKERLTLNLPMRVSTLDLSPDGKWVGFPKEAILLEMVEVATGQPRQALRVSSGIMGSAFSSDGKALFAFHPQGATMLDALTGQQRWFLRIAKKQLYCLALSADSQVLAAAEMDGTIHLIDGARGQEVKVLEGFGKRVGSLAFSPDGKTLAAAGIGNGQEIALWDIPSGDGTKPMPKP